MKLLIIVVLLGIVAYAGYRYFLPSMIATTLTSDEPSRLTPKKMQQQVGEIKAKIEREVEEIPALLQETRLDVDDLENIIDRVEPNQVFNAIDELKTTTLTSTDQVFDICMKHIRIEGYDLEVFRGPFVRNTSVRNIREAVTKLDRNDILTTMSVPVLKETAKQVLDSSREEILAELNK